MRSRYPPESRQQIIELVHAGRNPKELARGFKPSEQTIRNWVKQADLDAGRRSDGLTTEDRPCIESTVVESAHPLAKCSTPSVSSSDHCHSI